MQAKVDDLEILHANQAGDCRDLIFKLLDFVKPDVADPRASLQVDAAWRDMGNAIVIQKLVKLWITCDRPTNLEDAISVPVIHQIKNETNAISATPFPE